MAHHCMHVLGEEVYPGQSWVRGFEARRYCCWCSLEQTRERVGEPIHGPRFRGERHQHVWYPPSTNNDCPRDQADSPPATIGLGHA